MSSDPDKSLLFMWACHSFQTRNDGIPTFSGKSLKVLKFFLKFLGLESAGKSLWWSKTKNVNLYGS